MKKKLKFSVSFSFFSKGIAWKGGGAREVERGGGKKREGREVGREGEGERKQVEEKVRKNGKKGERGRGLEE